MFKLIIFVLIIFVVIGSGNVFNFNTQDNLWIIQINHQELLNSIGNGYNIIYDFINELIQSNANQDTTK